MSCCDCFKIKVGSEYLDLPNGFGIDQFKAREGINNLGVSGQLQALEASVPATEKNKRLAADLINPSPVGPSYRPVDCLVFENGQALAFDKIQFVGTEDASQSINFLLLQGSNHWIKQAGATTLPDIETLGSYTFTAQFVDDVQTNNASYTDGDLGVYFPLVNFGKFLRGRSINWNENNDPNAAPETEFSESQVTLEDYRPHFHLLSILQKGFCFLGWSFRCPILETATGRRIGAYLLDEGLGTDPDFLRTAKFESALPADPNPDQEFFDIEVFDNADNFQNGRFSTPGVYDFLVVFRGTQTVFEEREGAPPELFLYVYKYDADGTVVDQLLVAPVRGNAFDDQFIVEDVELASGQYVRAFIQGVGIRITVDESRFYNKPKRVIIQRGQTIEIKDIIGSYNFLDLVKGWAHFINARFVTDYVNREVYFYAPTDVDFYGEAAEGFISNTFDDWTAKVVPGSAAITKETERATRFHRFVFAQSNDAAISDLSLGEDGEYLQRVLDLGQDFEPGETEYRNPFFQPTVNQQLDIFFPNYITNGLTDLRPYVPQMLDNEDGKLSFDIGPRLLYFAGLVQQETADASRTSFFRYEGSPQQLVPYAYQVPNEDVYIGGSQPEIRLAYGDFADVDAFSQFWRNDVLAGIISKRISLSVELTQNEWSQASFRAPKRIFYDGQTFVAELLELPARRSCSRQPVQAILQPVPFVGDYCAGPVVEGETCNNRPRISTSIDFDAGTISAVADNTQIDSTIDTEAWEYSTDDGETFAAYTPGTDITGQERVVFRRTVTFSDGCSEKVVTRVADLTALCANTPGISLDYDQLTQTVTATRTGDFNSTINTDQLFVTIDGGTETSYTEGAEISNFSTVLFRRAVTYTNACPDTEVTAQLDATELPCQNSPEIQFTQLADGVYTVQISGAISSQIAYSDIQISYDNGGQWVVWDRSPIVVSGTFLVRAIVHYADNCPTQTITAQCPV